jgi:peptidoglycan/LPS O-acetylase OafA/YrhL
MNDPRGTNLELEGVRGIACLLVALGHSLYLNHLDPSVTLPAWLRTVEADHAGVLVFFVLSGYLIGWTNAGPFSPKDSRAYVRRRVLRLAPIYYVALALSAAVLVWRREPGQIRAVAATAVGLQNLNDYFGLHLPPPMTNGPLWSLNYELLYYAAFILLWRFRPRLAWVFLPAATAAFVAWFWPRYVPLFLASYACGWLFWAAGWWLARQPEAPPPAASSSALTWLLLVFAGYQFGGAAPTLNFLVPHGADAGMITLSDLGMLPPILLLLAAVTHRQPPAAPLVAATAWLLCLVPLVATAASGHPWTQPAWVTGSVAVLLAMAALLFRTTAWLRPFAALGRISYAFYVVHFPLLLVVQRSGLPGGTLFFYFVRVAVWAGVALTLAWLLELRFQPWIKARLHPPQFAVA